jgi:hypothetical protein
MRALPPGHRRQDATAERALVREKQSDQRLATFAIVLVEPPDQRAVEHEHAKAFTGFDQRNGQRRARRRIAFYMRGKIADIVDQHALAAPHCRATHAFADGDAQRCRQALERPQQQFLPL